MFLGVCWASYGCGGTKKRGKFVARRDGGRGVFLSFGGLSLRIFGFSFAG